jgi:hypothetical protein
MILVRRKPFVFPGLYLGGRIENPALAAMTVVNCAALVVGMTTTRQPHRLNLPIRETETRANLMLCDQSLLSKEW